MPNNNGYSGLSPGQSGHRDFTSEGTDENSNKVVKGGPSEGAWFVKSSLEGRDRKRKEFRTRMDLVCVAKPRTPQR